MCIVCNTPSAHSHKINQSVILLPCSCGEFESMRIYRRKNSARQQNINIFKHCIQRRTRMFAQKMHLAAIVSWNSSEKCILFKGRMDDIESDLFQFIAIIRFCWNNFLGFPLRNARRNKQRNQHTNTVARFFMLMTVCMCLCGKMGELT